MQHFYLPTVATDLRPCLSPIIHYDLVLYRATTQIGISSENWFILFYGCEIFAFDKRDLFPHNTPVLFCDVFSRLYHGLMEFSKMEHLNPNNIVYEKPGLKEEPKKNQLDIFQQFSNFFKF